MSNIKLLTVTDHPEHAEVLRRSSELHGWDCAVLEKPWRGFGTKIIETRDHLLAHPEIEYFVFADAFDVVVFGSPEEFMKKVEEEYGLSDLIFSTERGCWPMPQAEQHYKQKT